MTQQHTPTPWAYMEVENKYYAGTHHEGNKTLVTVATVYAGNEMIARCHSVENAALIVKAVNHHAELVELLSDCVAGMESDESGRQYGALPDKVRAILVKVKP